MKNIQQISDAELEIMEILWNNNNTAMLGQIMEDALVEEKQWKSNTVLTFLTRLIDKNMVSIQKKGRLNQYTALMSKEEYIKGVTAHFVRKVYGGDVKNLMTNLIKNHDLEENDIEELKEFWSSYGGRDE